MDSIQRFIKKQFFLFWNVKGEILALWFIFCYRNEKANQTAAYSSYATAVPATSTAAINKNIRIIRQCSPGFESASP